MASTLLVHGSWHGGWVWDEIATSLRARGHEVFVPSLRGLGEIAANLDPTVGLWTHVDDLESLIVKHDPGDHRLSGFRVIRWLSSRSIKPSKAVAFFDRSRWC